MSSLLEVTPGALVFALKKDSECRLRLYIRNISSGKIVFKVKTTMPNCYFVKPNQGVLGPSSAGALDKATIDIALTKEEVNRLIDLAAAGIPELASKHRFMVQNKEISESEYSQLETFSSGQKAEKYSQIWATMDADEKSKQEKMKKLLNVKFEYPAMLPTEGARRRDPSLPIPSVSETYENLRNKLAHESSEKNAAAASSSQESADFKPMTKDEILEDLVNLKMKFNAMLEFSVRLTSERDTLVLRLDETQRLMARMARTKKSEAVPIDAGATLSSTSPASKPEEGTGGAGDANTKAAAGAKKDKNGKKKGGGLHLLELPFYVAIVLIFASFFAGRYFRR